MGQAVGHSNGPVDQVSGDCPLREIPVEALFPKATEDIGQLVRAFHRKGKLNAGGIAASHFQAVQAVQEKIELPVFPERGWRNLPGVCGAGQRADPFYIVENVLFQGPADVFHPHQTAVDDFQVASGKPVGMDLDHAFLFGEESVDFLRKALHPLRQVGIEKKALENSILLQVQDRLLHAGEGAVAVQVTPGRDGPGEHFADMPLTDPFKGHSGGFAFRRIPPSVRFLDRQDAGQTAAEDVFGKGKEDQGMRRNAPRIDTRVNFPSFQMSKGLKEEIPDHVVLFTMPLSDCRTG